MHRKRKAAFKKRILMLGLLIVLAAVCIVIIPFSRFRVAAGEKENDSVYYMTYVVHTGDTLWGIADTYRNDTFSTHEAYINEVMRANGLESCHIYDGQLIIIPCDGHMNGTAAAANTLSTTN